MLLEQYIQDPTLTQSVDLTDNIEFENVEAVEADIEKKVIFNCISMTVTTKLFIRSPGV